MSKSDQRQMHRLSAVFLAGVVLIWVGLAQSAPNIQLVGVAVCVAGFAWLALGGWRVMRRRAREMRDGGDGNG